MTPLTLSLLRSVLHGLISEAFLFLQFGLSLLEKDPCLSLGLIHSCRLLLGANKREAAPNLGILRVVPFIFPIILSIFGNDCWRGRHSWLVWQGFATAYGCEHLCCALTSWLDLLLLLYFWTLLDVKSDCLFDHRNRSNLAKRKTFFEL